MPVWDTVLCLASAHLWEMLCVARLAAKAQPSALSLSCLLRPLPSFWFLRPGVTV